MIQQWLLIIFMISTTAFMLLILSAYLSTGYFRNPKIPGALNRTHKMLSHFFEWVMSYYGPNVTEIAMLSIVHFGRALGIPALVIWQTVLLAAGYHVSQKRSEDAPSQVSTVPFYEPTRDFSSQPIRLVGFVDKGVAHSIAILAGIKPNPESCGTVATSMLVVSIGYLGYLVGLRPYRSKMEQGIATANALLLLTVLCVEYSNASK